MNPFLDDPTFPLLLPLETEFQNRCRSFVGMKDFNESEHKTFSDEQLWKTINKTGSELEIRQIQVIKSWLELSKIGK